MYSQKRQKGNTAEEIVVLYLKNTGFQILDQNYLRKFDGFWENENKKDWNITVSCETDDSVFNPTWNMTNKKKTRFSKIIRTYLADKCGETMPDFQIDVVSVLLDFYQKVAYINRIENILLETS